MALFKTIAEIAKFVKISYANGSSALPNQDDAEEEYIVPVIGQALYDDLCTQVSGGAITSDALLKKVRKAAGKLIFYKELPYIYTQITDAGLRNATTDKMTGAYKHQYHLTLQALENDGLEALERLYEYMMANADTFIDWKSSEAYSRLNKNLIRTGKEFSKCYHLFQPHRTFFALQPVMQEAEDLYIKKAIGTDYFNYLKDVAEPTAEEIIVIDLLKKSIANFTIYKSISKLRIKVRPEGLTVMIADPDAEPQSEQNASANDLKDLREDTYKDANTYLNDAVIYLNANASLTVFATFFSSSYYVDPTKTKTDLNNTMNIYAF